MDQENPISQDAEASTRPSMPLGSRLANVFVSPGEVFDQVKWGKPSTGNWLVPLVLSCVMMVIFTMVAFSQPTVLQQIKDQQSRQFQKMVDQKKMTQQQADQVAETSGKFLESTTFRIIGGLGAMVGGAAWFFVMTLALWILGSKILHGGYSFMQSMEMVGLASMIGVLSMIIGILLVVAKGTMMVNFGPSFFIENIDMTKKLHQVLVSCNLLTFWYMGVLSVGLSRLSGACMGKCAGWIFGVWALIRVGTIVSGYGSGGI
jgi:hypothetical protein